MVDSHVFARATQQRRSWVTGGSLLLASVIFGAANGPPASLLGADIVARGLFAAALLVFAFGIGGAGGAGSVTARRTLGTATLASLSVWTVLAPVLEQMVLSGGYAPESLLTFGYADSLVQFALAAIAVTQIARAGVVPHPWNWAPMWALAVVAVPWSLQQVASVGTAQDLESMLLVIVRLDGLVRIGVTVFLGVLAVVLAYRPGRPQTVDVYRTPR